MTLYLLDTVVVSDAIKPPARRSDGVTAWFALQEIADLFLSSITVAEIGAGLEAMAPGPAKQRYEDWYTALIEDEFEDRVLAFDLEAAHAYRAVAARMPRSGWQRHARDMQIAAIALLHDMTVVTRNVRDFAPCGVKIVDPWSLSG